MKKIFILVLFWFILLNSINKLSSKLIFDNTSYELPKANLINHRFWIVPWLNFDGRNYLEIVNNGYTSIGKKLDLRVFFPLYPLIIRILSINLLINPILIGLAVSFTSFIASLYILNKLLIQDKIIEENRHRVFLILLLFPTSYYFLAYYSESTYLLISILMFYFLNKKNFILASFFTSLATAIRLVGLALLFPLLWEAIQTYKKTKKFPLSILFAPLGFIIYGLYTQFTTGNGFLIVEKHKEWNRVMGIFGPWNALKDSLLNVISGSDISRNNPIIHSIEILEFCTAIFIVIILIKSFRKIRFTYWLYMFFSSLFIFFSGFLGSDSRFIIVMFPVFIYLVKVLSKKYFYIICLCFLILLIYLSSLFLRGYWVA